MPTAVMTESSENTMSSSPIWTIVAANVAVPAPDAWPSSPSSISWISKVALASRNRPPTIRTRSRPEMSLPKIVKSGAVSPTMIESENSSAIRMISASAQADAPRPLLLIRAAACPPGSR